MTGAPLASCAGGLGRRTQGSHLSPSRAARRAAAPQLDVWRAWLRVRAGTASALWRVGVTPSIHSQTTCMQHDLLRWQRDAGAECRLGEEFT